MFYYKFIKILYDTFEFGYAGLFYYLLTGNIYIAIPKAKNV